MHLKFIFYILTSCLLSGVLFSCDSSKVYDSMQDLDSTTWNEKNELVYVFTIKDTAVAYKLYYSVRYTNDYPFYNLYINRTLEDSSGKFISKKLQGMDIFKANTGVTLGAGMGSKKDYLILSEDNYKFPYRGNYTLKLKQYMRQENIQGICAVGIRVEKIINTK